MLASCLESRDHDMPVCLLHMQVPGLAEARPSVMRGDALYVSLHSDPTGREWQGYVHMVRQEEVRSRDHSTGASLVLAC